MSYVLITPVRDEAPFLATLSHSVLSQTKQPALWVIIDGSSRDGTLTTAKGLFKDIDWIHVIPQRRFIDNEYAHKNFSQAINEAYEYARELAQNQHIHYDFVGKIDGTVRLSKDYFERLQDTMAADQSIVVTSGVEHVVAEGCGLILKSSEDVFIGFTDNRLYRRAFFEQIGGYPLTYSADTVLLIKAIKRGMKVKIVEGADYEEPRAGGTKIGVWNGHRLRGRVMYRFGYGIPLMLMTGLYHSTKNYPPYGGIALDVGYMQLYVRKEERIEDTEVIAFFSRERPRQILNLLKSKGLHL